MQCLCNVRLINKDSKHCYIEGVARDITFMKKATHDLKKAKDLAERSLKVKEGFLANMSHEIRTPMNGIIGMIDLIGNTELDEEQNKYVRTIKKSSETLLNILNDILDFSKIEAGKLHFEEVPFDFAECVEDAIELASEAAAAKQLDVPVILPPDLPTLIGDPGRIRQVLQRFGKVMTVDPAIGEAQAIAVTGHGLPMAGKLLRDELDGLARPEAGEVEAREECPQPLTASALLASRTDIGDGDE